MDRSTLDDRAESDKKENSTRGRSVTGAISLTMREKLHYALLFCLSAPLLLAEWMARLDVKLFSLPEVQTFSGGLVVAGLGSALMLRAMWLRLPPDGTRPTNCIDGLAAFVLAYLPWAIAYAACGALGAGAQPIDTMLPFERGWPVWEWTAVVYFWAYPWAVLAPFLVNTQCQLRQFVRTGLIGTAFISWCFLVFPFIAVPRPVDPASVMGPLLLTERALDTVSCAFPSFHVFWAFVAADAWRVRLGARASLAIAVMIAASCLTISAHSLLDVIAGWMVYAGASRVEAVWATLRRGAARLVKFRPEWRLGLARGENGPRTMWYPGVCLVACLLVLLMPSWWENGWLLCGGFAVAAPVIEGMGRLRGLMPARIHGSIASTGLVDRRDIQPVSLPGKLAELEGGPGSLASAHLIAGNLAIFGLLARLWHEGANLAFITGAYLVLRSCVHLMAEDKGGMPVAALRQGLRLQHWLAVACFSAGVGMMLVPAPVTPQWSASFAPPASTLPIAPPASFAPVADLSELPHQKNVERLSTKPS